jgi:hypothetical protein
MNLVQDFCAGILIHLSIDLVNIVLCCVIEMTVGDEAIERCKVPNREADVIDKVASAAS